MAEIDLRPVRLTGREYRMALRLYPFDILGYLTEAGEDYGCVLPACLADRVRAQLAWADAA